MVSRQRVSASHYVPYVLNAIKRLTQSERSVSTMLPVTATSQDGRCLLGWPPSDVADGAVDNHVGARHERALTRGEEEGGVGDLLGLRESQHRSVAGVALTNRGGLLGRGRLGVEHRRVDDARAQRV